MHINPHVVQFMSQFPETGLTFDDVTLVTQYADFLPENTSLSTRLTSRINLNIPFVSAAMDTVTESQMAISMAMLGGINALMPKLDLPFTIVETIAYDPKARDLSIEVAKAKAAKADLVMTVTRLNDAILLVREMVKQQVETMGIISPGAALSGTVADDGS